MSIATSPLLSILFVLLAALVSASVLTKLRQPTLIGFILGGIFIGPHGMGLVPYENVELLADIGVGLLMFTIGLELSIQELLRVKYISTIGGSALLIVTTLLAFAFKSVFHLSQAEALIWGISAGLSSTVVVLKLLAERGEVGSTQGNISTGILLYQDVISVPIIVFVPLFASRGAADFSITEIFSLIGKFAVYVALLYSSARYIVPRFLRFVASTHSKELFSISILCISLGIAGITHSLGLSLALGAFLAGLIVSDSDFGNQAASEVLPLKDAFSAIFFVSIGMLLDFQFCATNWDKGLLAFVLIVVFKFFIVFALVIGFRYPVKIATYVGLALAQVGEFTFLLLQTAQKQNLVGRETYQLILGSAIITIIATPYLLKTAPRLKKYFAFINRSRWINRGTMLQEDSSPQEQNELYADHVIVCGYGPTGSIVIKKLQGMGYPVVVVDLNYKVVQSLKANKIHAIYGDSSSTIVLRAANIHQAAMLVVTIPDPSAMKALVRKVKQIRPDLPIILRVKYASDRDDLVAIGADDIVWEEFESGQELSRRVLSRLSAK